MIMVQIWLMMAESKIDFLNGKIDQSDNGNSCRSSMTNHNNNKKMEK